VDPRRLLVPARVLLAAVFGAAVAVALAGSIRAPIGPFDTMVIARPSLNSVSTVKVAPLGSIELDTHAGPVGIVLRVEELRPDEAERIARDPAVLHSVEDEIASDARDALVGLLFRVVGVCTLGGGLGAFALARRTWGTAVAGSAVGALVAGAVAVVAVATFEPEAVAEPRYSGLLAAAPNAVGDVESIIEQFDDYRAQLAELVGNVAALYRAGQGLPELDPGEDTIRVLHVSDIHNNPQAFDLMEQLIDQFDLQAVIDSGDLTDWGTAPESQLVGQIAGRVAGSGRPLGAKRRNRVAASITVS